MCNTCDEKIITVPVGPQGPQGLQGEPGPQGIQGVEGIQGPIGECDCPEYTVGQVVHGGVVAYVDEHNHGIVVFIEDAPTTLPWVAGNHAGAGTGDFTVVGALSDCMFGGISNTPMIVSNAMISTPDNRNSTFAAKYCHELSGGLLFQTKYGDWYLPSKTELNFIYDNIGLINASLVSLGGSAKPLVTSGELANYWSSVEDEDSFSIGLGGYANAFYFNMDTGSSSSAIKINTLKVRAIRRF